MVVLRQPDSDDLITVVPQQYVDQDESSKCGPALGHHSFAKKNVFLA